MQNIKLFDFMVLDCDITDYYIVSDDRSLPQFSQEVESKGMILMSGEYDKNTITYEEATCLSVQLLYYKVKPNHLNICHDES